MKAKILAASLLALSSTAFATDVGVSVSVGQPGFYGRLDIGDFPPPQVVYREPVLIQRPVRYVETAPIYLRVPPGHMKHWGQHCAAYHACGQRVFFVQDGWYSREYAPRYRARMEHGYDGHREQRHEMHREAQREERHEERHEARREERNEEHHDGRGHDGDHGDHGGHGHRD